MPAFIDRTKERHGKLLVLRRDPENPRKWICLCDCTNEVSVFSSNLSRDHSTSCGKCWQHEFPIEYAWGRLKVVGASYLKGGQPYVRCKCKCGNIIEVRHSWIREQTVFSCGCMKNEKATARWVERHASSRIDRLNTIIHGIRIIEDLGLQGHGGRRGVFLVGVCVHCGAGWRGWERYLMDPNTKGGFCRCQKSILLRETHRRYRIAKGFDPDSLITEYTKAVRQVTVPLHNEIKRRDGGRCLLCGEQSPEELHVHHIEKVLDAPDRAADPYNLASLCGVCHLDAHDGFTKGPVNSDLQVELWMRVKLNEDAHRTHERLDLVAMRYEIENLDRLHKRGEKPVGRGASSESL